MKSEHKFNALNGCKNVSRQQITEVIDIAKQENNCDVVFRLSKILNDQPKEQYFNIVVASYPDSGLNGAKHTGDYKEALDDCGRLRKGFHFVGGKVVKVGVKPKPTAVKKATAKTEIQKSNDKILLKFVKNPKIEYSYHVEKSGRTLTMTKSEFLKSNYYNENIISIDSKIGSDAKRIFSRYETSVKQELTKKCKVGEETKSYSKIVKGNIIETTDKVVLAFDSAFKLKNYVDAIKGKKSNNGATKTDLSFFVPQWHYADDVKLWFNYNKESNCPYEFITIEDVTKTASNYGTKRKREIKSVSVEPKNTISITTEIFRKMSVNQLRDFTIDYYSKNLKGKKVAIKNHLKEVIFVSNAGRKMLKPMYSEKVAVLEHLEELIKNSTYNNFGERKDTDSKDVLGYLNFKSKITIDGIKRHVRISVILDIQRKTNLKTFEIGKKEKSDNSREVAVANPIDEGNISLSENKTTNIIPNKEIKAKKIIGYALVDNISSEIVASKKTLNELKTSFDKLVQATPFDELPPLIYEIYSVNNKNVLGNKIDGFKNEYKTTKTKRTTIKNDNIIVGKTFLLDNKETISIIKLFTENTDETWVEYSRNGTNAENEINNLRQFLNRLNAVEIQEVKPTPVKEKTEKKENKTIDFEQKYKVSFSELVDFLSAGSMDLPMIYNNYEFATIEPNYTQFATDFLNHKYYNNIKVSGKGYAIFEYDSKESLTIAVETLQHFAVKTPAKKDFIDNLKNIVIKDELRPVMTGIYIDKDYYVATDAHVLVCLSNTNNTTEVGKILDLDLEKDYKDYIKKAGSSKPELSKTEFFEKYKYIGGIYPKYEAVIPNYKNFTTLKDVNYWITICENFLKYTQAEKGLINALVIGTPENEVILNVKNALRVFKSLAENGNQKIKIGYAASNKAIIVKTETKDFCLIMPIREIDSKSITSERINLPDGFNENGLSGPGLNSLFKNAGLKDPAKKFNEKKNSEIIVKEFKNRNNATKKTVSFDLNKKAKNVKLVKPTKKPKPLKGVGLISNVIGNVVANAVLGNPAKTSIAAQMKQRANTKQEYYIVPDKDIANFLGKIEKKTKESVAITLTGGQGSMKTRLCFQLMNTLAQNYKVGHASIEEHPASTLYYDKVHQYLNNKAMHNVSAPEINSIDDVHKLCRENDVIVIDSFSKLQEMQRGCELDKDFRKAYDGKLFIIIYQLTSDGKMRGGAKSQFDGDIIGFIKKEPNYKENYCYWDKNRYQSKNLEDLKFNIYQGKLQSNQQEPEADNNLEFSFNVK